MTTDFQIAASKRRSGRRASACAAGLLLLLGMPVMLQAGVCDATVSKQNGDSGATRLAASPASCDGVSVLATPGSKLPEVAPTRIRIMNARYKDLSDALVGYQKTGIALVAFNGKAFGPAGALDDPGSYYLIPKISVLLKVPLKLTIDLFYFSLIMLTVVIGTVGFWASLNTKLGKWLALAWVVAVVASAYHAGDVYILSAFTPLTVVPWLMYSVERRSLGWFLPAFLFVEGLIIGLAHTVRAHSGTALLIFTLCILLFHVAAPKTHKALLVTALLVGLLVPQLYLRVLVAERDAFLASVCPSCPKFPARHPFWHSTYIGFGFLTNEYVPSYTDAVAYARVQTIAPGTVFGSAKYEHILRQEVLAFIRHHPGLVVTTLAAKAGVILLVFLAVANIGLLAAVRYRKPWPIELGFWSSIAFSSLPGLLVVPSSSGYMLGLATFASLYAVSSTDFALSNGSGHAWRCRTSGLDDVLR